jgi:hypothetical protein
MNIFQKIRNFSEQILSIVIISSPPIVFVILLNIKFKLAQLQDKVYYDKESETYRLETQGEIRNFKTKFQNYNSYAKGGSRRNLKLIEEYLLRNVKIEPNDLIIDCGANLGDFYFALRSKYKSFNYSAF